MRYSTSKHIRPTRMTLEDGLSASLDTSADAELADIELAGGPELIPTDPLFSNQWHLHNTTPGQLDLNITSVWDDYTGAGIRVAVIDNGFDRFHDDYDANFNYALDYDYINNDFAADASGTQNHGTAVMGIIGAEQGNGIGGVGIAWNADLVGFQGFGIDTSYGDDNILDAAGLGDGIGNTNGNVLANGSDVISMSGGLGSTVFLNTTNITNAQNALETIAEDGRGGLGTIFVKSSGNSRAGAGSTAREEGTADGYDTVRHSINVAAVEATGVVTSYSTPGANVLVSAFAPDNDVFQPGITTTDRTGVDGYNTAASPTGDYTSTFNGTSAAAPQVAGVVALMLEANDQLGWRDVQQILAYSARHAGSAVGTSATGSEQATQTNGSSWYWNAADNWNGGGLHFSNDYGYGVVDALAAVRLAETWDLQSTSANETEIVKDMDGAGVTTAITDNTSVDFTQSITTDVYVQHVRVEISFSTTFLADLEVFLTSADGTRVQLIADTGDSADFNGRWTFGTTAFLGESSAGSWTVSVGDDAGGDATETTDVDLKIYGSAVNPNDALFVFTNEFSDYDGVAGHSTSFSGGSTGVDTINVAAVTSASTIDLKSNTGTIDGVAITNSHIQVVYGGDGGDTIIGDGFSTELHGGRGNDRITSGSANEMLFGDAGNDDFILDAPGAVGNDSFRGGVGHDELVIKAVGTYDLSASAVQFSGVEEIRFDSGGAGSTLILYAQEIDNADELRNVIIDGFDGGGTDEVQIVMGSYSTLDISGWTFQDWNNTEKEVVVITGDTSSETVVGSVQADEIFGNDGLDNLRGGTGKDFLSGGTGDDLLRGDGGKDILKGGQGDDIVKGGTGADDLYGGVGRDTQTGGLGNDIFRFKTLAESRVGSGMFDKIKDFSQADDLVHIKKVDAIAGGINDSFTFIGTTGYSGTAGELRYKQVGSITKVLGDVDGDGLSDFKIEFNGLIAFTADDFIL